ncbi:MAG: TadE/TadG family type IV pilus assembly protein [Anaerolineae bacterium]
MKRSRSQRSRGSNLIEAALAVPLLILLLIGVADLGRAFQVHITLLNAAREGARYAARDSDPVAITQRVVAEAALSRVALDPGMVSIVHAGAGNPVEVRVAYPYNLFVGHYIGLDALTIRAQATFRASGGGP